MKNLVYSIIVIIIITGLAGCPVGPADGGGSALIDKATLAVTIAAGSLLPAANVLALEDEAGQVIQTLAAALPGTYNIADVDVQFANQTKRVYTLFIFSDADADMVYDAAIAAEADTYTVLETVNMGAYAGTPVALSYTVNKYSGTVAFHADMGSDAARRYVCCVNSYTGAAAYIPVQAGGAVEFYNVRTVPEQSLSLYAFYDTNGDGKMSDLDDKIAYLFTQGNGNSNTGINVMLVKAYGTLAYSGADGRYDFDSAVNPPVLRIEDQSYFRTFYQPVGTDGSFAVYLAKNHTADIRLYHVLAGITDYAAHYKDNLVLPVRVAGPSSYSADKEIFGIGGTGTTMKIHQVTIKVVNPLAGLESKRLYALAGQYTIPFALYTGSDASPVMGTQDTGGTNYVIYFRDFDRTTTTSGAFNDATLGTTTTGWGSFYNMRVFIDVNNDGALTPEDPRSNIFYYGDIGVGGTIDWSNDNSTDWSDLKSISYINADMDFTGTTLTLAPL